jgi:ribosomal protein L22
MADETPIAPGADSPDGSEEVPSQKPARGRSRGASGEPVAGAGEEKPKRTRRPSRKADAEQTPQEERKPRRTRVGAKDAAQKTVAQEAVTEEETAAGPTAAEGAAGAKPKRLRARSAKAAEEAGEPPARGPARAAPAPSAGTPGASRRLVSRRSSKDAPAREPQLVHAHARYVRSSARKARIVCDHIRGKSVPEARAILAFAPRGVAKDWSKLLDSAVANAEHNHELVGDELRVKEVFADVGPTLKRFRPRAMGRATPINKRTSHLSITLAPKE